MNRQVDLATLPDRGGIWPVPFTANERYIIRTQRKYDRRNIPQLWLWTMIRPNNARDAEGENTEDFREEGTDMHELFFESPRVAGHRAYATPIAAHVYIDWTQEKKGRKKGTTETTGSVKLWMSRAEARRLGRLLTTFDDCDNLVAAEDAEAILRGNRVPRPGENEPLYILRPGDILRFRDCYYEVDQMEVKFHGATDIPTHWDGSGHVVREDSTAPGMLHLPEPPSFRPPGPAGAPVYG